MIYTTLSVSYPRIKAAQSYYESLSKLASEYTDILLTQKVIEKMDKILVTTEVWGEEELSINEIFKLITNTAKDFQAEVTFENPKASTELFEDIAVRDEEISQLVKDVWALNYLETKAMQKNYCGIAIAKFLL